MSELPDHIMHSDYVTEFFGGHEFPCNESVGCETADLLKNQLSTVCQDTTGVLFSGQVASE